MVRERVTLNGIERVHVAIATSRSGTIEQVSCKKLLVLVTAAAIIVSGCASSDSSCGPVQDEPLDELSAQHVIAGTDVRFDEAAPSSGPHLSIIGPAGMSAEPLPPLEQVTLIESGKVLVQFRPDDVAASDVEAFASETVAVAPNPDLNSPVTLTAWQVRQECESVDVATTRAFISRYVGAPKNH